MKVGKFDVSSVFISIALVLMASSFNLIQSQSTCPNQDDYSPCTCSGGFPNTITCSGADMLGVKDVFTKTKPVFDLLQVDLRPIATDVAGIPANVLAYKRAKFLAIRCPTSDYQLKIDYDGFRNSEVDMFQVTIQYCDFSLLNLAFLEGFNSLTSLVLTSNINVHRAFATLRPLPSLQTLNLYNSKGLNEANWNYPSPLVKGLTDLDCGANGLENAAATRLLNWLSLSPSTNTLKLVYLDSNSLTQVPSGIGNFLNLSAIDLAYNQISRIPKGSLSFTSPVQRLNLNGNQINTIAADSFNGDFSNARVQVQNNKLTRFEASAFQNILIQMTKVGSTGSLYASGNQYDCTSDPCHLAWLVDSNQHRDLLSKIDFITCSNGVRISNLPEANFNNCLFKCAYDGTQRKAPCSSEFYICSNGTPYLFSCASPEILRFNEYVGTCDYPKNIQACSQSP